MLLRLLERDPCANDSAPRIVVTIEAHDVIVSTLAHRFSLSRFFDGGHRRARAA